MRTADHERYIFYDLAYGDMIRARKSIKLIATIEDAHLIDVLCRDAIISYCRPFANNKGVFILTNLVLTESFVSRALRSKHRGVLEARNELVAHLDLSKQSPKLNADLSYNVNGYELARFDDIMLDIEKLATSVERAILRASIELERAFNSSAVSGELI